MREGGEYDNLYLRTPLFLSSLCIKPSTPTTAHHSSQQRSDIPIQLLERGLQVVVDNNLVVGAGLGGILELLLGLGEALLQRVGRLGAAALEARFERLQAGRLEKDEICVEVGLFDLFYALCVCVFVLAVVEGWGGDGTLLSVLLPVDGTLLPVDNNPPVDSQPARETEGSVPIPPSQYPKYTRAPWPPRP